LVSKSWHCRRRIGAFSLADGPMIRKLVSIISIVLGLMLAVLGYENAFGLVGCASGSYFCIRTYTYDVLAVLIGSIVVLIGAIRLSRAFFHSHP